MIPVCVNSGLLKYDILIKANECGLLNDDILIKINVSMVVYWMMIPNVSMVVYWMMIFWLKQSDTCVNGGLLNDDILIKTKWYLCQ